MNDYVQKAQELVRLLGLEAPPIAITFTDAVPDGVPSFDEPMSEPTPDGRQGRVPAGCVFWMKSTDRTLATVPEDHGNCSVGSLTHGLIPLEEAAGRADVAELVRSGWVSEEVFPQIPTVAERPEAILYGPLADTPVDPDVVLLRLNPKQAMELADACPDMHLGGKPQCHIVPLAKEHGQVAASVGCALSRVRTGMKPTEMTATIPGPRLGEVVDALRRAIEVDDTVRAYAAEDKRRFS